MNYFQNLSHNCLLLITCGNIFSIYFSLPEEVVVRMQKVEGYVPKKEVEEEKDVRTETSILKTVWNVMEYPETSFLARLIAFLSILVILVSMVNFCAETLPQFHSPTKINIEDTIVLRSGINNCTVETTPKQHRHNPSVKEQDGGVGIDPRKVLDLVEVACTSWFTFEYVVRFISSPNKLTFLKSFLNLVDLLAILPYFIMLGVSTEQENGSPLSMIRVARLFRIFKLSRHFGGLKILGEAFKASLKELGIIVFMMCFSIMLFSSAIYYAESDGADSAFASIPDTFWYVF